MQSGEPLIVHSDRGEPLLYRLRDGRFQIVVPGEIGSILSGPDYVLVSEALAAVLQELCSSDLQFELAAIFDPATNVTRTCFREIRVRQAVTSKMLTNGEPLTGNAWLCGKGILVVSRQVRDAIAANAITGVQFSPPIFLG